jgi:arylsulfatase A-like enzyme
LNGEHGMVDKRTMHEPSIRVPLLARYPGLTPVDRPKVVEQMVLHQDLAPSILELCGAPALKGIHGESWVPLVRGEGKGWRTSWFYEYNYEKEFPYTPNVRGVRTDDWVFIRYPHGDGKPDRHKAELYHLATDPEQTKNRIDEPAQRDRLVALQAELIRLQRAVGLDEDRMPLDEGIKQVLPSPKIR